MNAKSLLLINLLAIQLVSAETVYKTRDADGNIVFSDVQTEGAELIEIQQSQTINVPKVNLEEFRKTTKLMPKEVEYTQFEIISPENESTIRSNEGKVNINIEISPLLDKKHLIVFFMDGKEVSSGKTQQLSLTELERGSHTVSATIINEKDSIIKRSNKLTFYLRKDSVLFRNRENNAAAAVPAQNNSTNNNDSSFSAP